MSLIHSLPGRSYVDPSIYEAERQSIFRRTWQLIGPADELAEPGLYRAADIAGWKVFVLRGRDGLLRGFHNLCRHRGAKLLKEGQGRCDLLRCPYHLWLYDHEGRLRKAPWFGEDPKFRVEDYPLIRVSVAEWRGLLFVAIDPETSLEDQLGALPAAVADQPLEDFRLAGEERFEIGCNWKTYTDNFVEGYHIPGIHPGFRKKIDFEAFETWARDGLVHMSAPLKGNYFYGGAWLWAWPNWTLSVYPDGMNTSRINPLGPDRTELIYRFYFADLSEAGASQRAETIASNCQIVLEDFSICEGTQANYASGAFARGPLSPRHEAGVAYFQERVRQTLAQYGEPAVS